MKAQANIISILVALASTITISDTSVYAQEQQIVRTRNPASASDKTFEGLALHISPVGIPVSNGNPILINDDQKLVLDLEITNSGTQTKTIVEQGNAVDDFIITLKNSDGTSVPYTTYGNGYAQPPNRKQIRRIITWQVEPGKTLHFYIWLDKIFDLSSCGQFTVQAQREVAHLSDQDGGLLVSNTLSFSIQSVSVDEVVKSAQAEQKNHPSY